MIALSVYYERSAFKSVLRMCADRPALPATDFVSKTSYTKSFQISVQIQFANVYRVNITFGRAYVSGVLISSLLTIGSTTPKGLFPHEKSWKILVLSLQKDRAVLHPLFFYHWCAILFCKNHTINFSESLRPQSSCGSWNISTSLRSPRQRSK